MNRTREQISNVRDAFIMQDPVNFESTNENCILLAEAVGDYIDHESWRDRRAAVWCVVCLAIGVLVGLLISPAAQENSGNSKGSLIAPGAQENSGDLKDLN